MHVTFKRLGRPTLDQQKCVFFEMFNYKEENKSKS